MMRIFRSIALATVAIASIVGCSKESIDNPAPELNRVSFGASIIDESDEVRATLIPDANDVNFSATWEASDKIGIYAQKGINPVEHVEGSWSGTGFEATLTASGSDNWTYSAYHPYSNTEKVVPFGSDRTQSGNDYNSNYDLMVSGEVTTIASEGGLDGTNHVTFDMKRVTSMAYFHLKTATEAVKLEKVVSATLEVVGGNIAATSITLDPTNESVYTVSGGTNSITITYDTATAPTASDFKAWFNILAGTFSSMKLTIETEGYRAVISRSSSVTYVRGKLHKVVMSIADSKWQVKVPKKYVKVVSTASDWSGTYLITGVRDDNTINALSVKNTTNSTATSLKSGDAVDVTSHASDDKISQNTTTDAVACTITKTTNGYSIQINNGQYLGWSSGNTLDFNDSFTASSCEWTISNSGGNVTITNHGGTQLSTPVNRIIRFNTGQLNTSGPFRCYTASTGVLLNLYKLE